MTDRVDVLRDIAAGLDTHDLDRILQHFADDAVFESPRDSETPVMAGDSGKRRLS